MSDWAWGLAGALFALSLVHLVRVAYRIGKYGWRSFIDDSWRGR